MIVAIPHTTVDAEIQHIHKLTTDASSHGQTPTRRPNFVCGGLDAEPTVAPHVGMEEEAASRLPEQWALGRVIPEVTSNDVHRFFDSKLFESASLSDDFLHRLDDDLSVLRWRHPTMLAAKLSYDGFRLRLFNDLHVLADRKSVV